MYLTSCPRGLFARPTTNRLLLALAAVAALGTLVPLQAAPPVAQEPATAQDDPMEAARELHSEYVELQNRVNLIEEKTMEAHPELQKQQQALLDLMIAKMPSSGTSAKDDLARIEQLEQKLRSEDTPENERQALMAEYQEKAQVFRAAQRQVLEDPEVQQTHGALMDAKLAAMKEEDPRTEQLMEQLQQKQQQLKQLMEAAGHAD